MFNFLTVAVAETAGAAQTSAAGTCSTAQGTATSFPPQLILMVVIFGAMFYLMFRSQKKQAKKRQQMIDSIVKGSDVIVGGGIHGTIITVKDKCFVVQIADKVNIEVNKAGVNGVVNTETKSAEK